VVAPSLNVTVPVGVGVPEAGVTVAVRVTLVPTATEVADAASFDVVAVGTGATPVPVMLTTCGLPEALSVKVRVAVSAVAVLAVKLTLIVHVFPAVTVAALHMSEETVKSALFVPPSTTELMFRLALPLLVTVNVIALLVAPSVWLPKAMGEGEAENPGAGAVAPVTRNQ